MHFYESSIITTIDGIHFQVYGNEHPIKAILAKPKYIPTEKIECNKLQSRFISGRKMNRLNLWADKQELKKYIEDFKTNYPEYICTSDMHDKDRLFFGIPINKIERIYSPKKGLSELMKIDKRDLDPHLKLIHDFVIFIMESGLNLDDLGITYSSLVGHYFSSISDINLVVHGKENFWKLMKYLETANNPLLRWKTKEQWLDFRKKRNRMNIFNEDEFLKIMQREKSEGFFGNSLFVIFGVEKENETWFKWGQERYQTQGLVTVRGIVEDNYNSIVRPGFYEIENSKIIDSKNEFKDIFVKKIVFYSRDYAMLAYPGEVIEACGILEKVIPKNGESYYRVVVGYFDSYLDERREKEYIKLLEKV